MNKGTFQITRIAIVIIVAALIGWAVSTGNPMIPMPTAIAGAIIVLLLHRSVKEVTVDERIYSIAEKASLIAFRIFTILAAATGATLVAIGQNGESMLTNIGFTLNYSACALVICYYIAYTWYNHKYGGTERG